jgi:hypothetical protein
VRIPFPADVRLDDLEKMLEVLDKLEYLFLASNPSQSVEIVRVIAHLRIVVTRVINNWEKVRLTREVQM